MKAYLVLVALTVACSAVSILAQPAGAAPCEWIPSSACPAPNANAASYPCSPNQIKGDWNDMTYHLPGQPSYSQVGSGSYADTWCFDQEQQASNYGFRRAGR